MIDIKEIRENPEKIRKTVQQKKASVDVDKLLELDTNKRKLQFDFDQLKASQNKISKQIPELKKTGKDVTSIFKQMQEVSSELKSFTAQLNNINRQIDDLLIKIPNNPHSSVPLGKDEQDNVIVKNIETTEDASLKEHYLLAEELGIIDLPCGAKITGSGFPVYRKSGALLERALINFMLDFHREKHGYEEVAVPFVVNRKSMLGTGQLPKLEADMYHIDLDDLFLIPTAEVPVTNIYSGEILSYKDLPRKFVAYTPCFRREAGSYGKDTKGLQRIHQFNKVELVRFVSPEESYNALEEMVEEAEAVLKALEIPFRKLLLCSGDMSFASAKTYDLEVWAPGMKKFLEVSSLSNFEDFQARRASIRYKDENGKTRFVHTLNGSGLATPRTFIAIIENYQDKDGSIRIPEVLRKYLNGLSKIEK